jgi:hypothetical protein
MTSIVGPLGGTTGGSGSVHHQGWRRCQWRASWGAMPVGLAASATKFEDGIDGGGTVSGPVSIHH